MMCVLSATHETREYTGVTSITLPALTGEIELLPGVAESFILLGPGRVVWRRGNQAPSEQVISEGMCHARENRAVIIYKPA